MWTNELQENILEYLQTEVNPKFMYTKQSCFGYGNFFVLESNRCHIHLNINSCLNYESEFHMNKVPKILGKPFYYVNFNLGKTNHCWRKDYKRLYKSRTTEWYTIHLTRLKDTLTKCLQNCEFISNYTICNC